tara:strand:+ start:1563 stop:1940 length:378 start_codon:yes stop_codon:yes gene_type:complete
MAFEKSLGLLGEGQDYIQGMGSPALQFDLGDFIRSTPRSSIKPPAYWEGATGSGSDMILDPISGSRFAMGTQGAMNVADMYAGRGRHADPYGMDTMTGTPRSASYFRGDVHPFAQAMGYGGDLYA